MFGLQPKKWILMLSKHNITSKVHIDNHADLQHLFESLVSTVEETNSFENGALCKTIIESPTSCRHP